MLDPGVRGDVNSPSSAGVVDVDGPADEGNDGDVAATPAPVASSPVVVAAVVDGAARIDGVMGTPALIHPPLMLLLLSPLLLLLFPFPAPLLLFNPVAFPAAALLLLRLLFLSIMYVPSNILNRNHIIPTPTKNATGIPANNAAVSCFVEEDEMAVVSPCLAAINSSWNQMHLISVIAIPHNTAVLNPFWIRFIHR